MKEQEIINKARKGFDEDFAKKDYMEKRTGDDDQLKKIINRLNISYQNKILDLGTGSGQQFSFCHSQTIDFTGIFTDFKSVSNSEFF